MLLQFGEIDIDSDLVASKEELEGAELLMLNNGMSGKAAARHTPQLLRQQTI